MTMSDAELQANFMAIIRRLDILDGGLIGDIEEVDQATTIAQINRRLELVHEYVDAHIGQSWGTANDQWPHGTPVFPFREIHTLGRQSINSAFPITFTVDYDEFIAKLHSAKLRVNFHNVRSNVSAGTGAAGGGTTVTSGGGGGSSPTSGAGSNHTHTVSGGTAASGGAQTSSDGGDVPITVSSQPTGGTTNADPSPASTGLQSGSHQHQENDVGGLTGLDSVNHSHSHNSHSHTIHRYVISITGGLSWTSLTDPGGSTLIPDHNHTVSDHTHSLSGITAANEGVHTHTVTIASHDHSVTIGTHTHTVTITYGIFEQAYANPGLRITINGTDRTVALGGPWNVAPSVLDVTEYLRETSGEPLRGANTIVFTVTSSLLDIEATLKSVALPANLLVAGL